MPGDKNARLARLETKRGEPERFIVVYEEGDKRWISTEIDYRQALSGEPDRFITEEEFQRLQAEYTVLLVSYVPFEDGKPESKYDTENET